MGRTGVGNASRSGATGGEVGADGARDQRNFGPRNPDGTWVAGVERGPSRPFPFPVGAVIGELTCLDWRRREEGPEWRRCSMYQPYMRCSCGWEGFIHRSNLRGGRTTRCNACAKKKSHATRMARRGFEQVCPDVAHRERLLTRISSIISRCTNPDNAVYPDYGGRGITAYPAWVENRVEFLRYLVGLDGWDQPELQLDRIDNNGGYVPGNLRFVTRSENMANKRRITAREVEALKQRVAVLEAENADLRHRASGPEESLHDPHG